MSFWLSSNYKAERLKYLLQQYQIDATGLQEVCINWSALHRKNTLADLLRYGQEPLRSVQSHNTTATKNMGRSMRGGTATVLTQHLSSYVKDHDMDYTGLWRWSWYCMLQNSVQPNFLILNFSF